MMFRSPAKAQTIELDRIKTNALRVAFKVSCIMTPAARVAAGIAVLDQINTGEPAEKVLTRWGRQNRYAGSKDRAAVRDLVYDVLRVRRSAAYFGGGTSGRHLMIGLLRLRGNDPETMFTGEGHAPAQLSTQEASLPAMSEPKASQWNLPDWLMPEFERSLEDSAARTARALQSRAPVTLRVNSTKIDRTTAIQSLEHDGITAGINPLSPTALTVTSGERRIKQSKAYLSGQVELQDAASQAVVDILPEATKCLDYCAGGGGKALAIAARFGTTVHAHDVAPQRMSDIPNRAKRAGAKIECLTGSQLSERAPYDLVLCDAPCSGSGAWRRSPEGKWALTEKQLADLMDIQGAILDRAAQYVKPGGWLVYATCSVLKCENEDRVSNFLEKNRNWHSPLHQRFDVTPDGDGFFTAHLTIA